MFRKLVWEFLVTLPCFLIAFAISCAILPVEHALAFTAPYFAGSWIAEKYREFRSRSAARLSESA